MKYLTKSISSKTFEDSQTKQKITLPGFAIMDESNKCFMIVYGENRLKSLFKKLNNE